jgi:uncharacterized membrane protein (DUF373 family)
MDEPSDPSRHPMMRVTERFEQLITTVLLVMMMLAILVSTIDLGWTLIKELIKPPVALIGVKEVSDIFGLVFMVLIGLELLETIKTYLTKDQLHVEIVFLVAMIAVARKVIILDIKELDAVMLLGIAALILALAAGFFFVRLAYRKAPGAPKAPNATPGH